jgi:hypothetical protein
MMRLEFVRLSSFEEKWENYILEKSITSVLSWKLSLLPKRVNHSHSNGLSPLSSKPFSNRCQIADTLREGTHRYTQVDYIQTSSEFPQAKE